MPQFLIYGGYYFMYIITIIVFYLGYASRRMLENGAPFWAVALFDLLIMIIMGYRLEKRG